MKFQFQDDLDFQRQAIDAVVGVFDTGANSAREQSFLQLASTMTSANVLELDDERILGNVQMFQKDNAIEEISKDLGSLDFSIEMETGTGKTYVYLRTLLELNQKYGLTKFIILVPSVAIREGVMKTIQQTNEHFARLYGQGIRAFEYDSSKLSRVRDFVNSPLMQVMVMTVQSFNKELNVMRQTPDQFNGDRPIDMIAATGPVIVMDEPQNMASDLAKAAIADLNPLFKLRYSATHKEKHNLLYSLGPEEAYNRRLVKKIAVYGVEKDTFFDIIEIRKDPIRVQAKLEVKKGSNYEVRKLHLQNADNLEAETNNNKYAGLSISEIHVGQGYVELSDGNRHYLTQSVDEHDKEKIFRLQIHETIKAHIRKQDQIGDSIKVLSLFFIDKVANYQLAEGLIKRLFNEEYAKLARHSDHFAALLASDVQGAYFAKKTKTSNEFKDSTSGDSKEDKAVYDLIMKHKERLLSFDEPIRFIFSHSALKEGWDNPNVFQICTLNETKSKIKKRQEIGRGLRLPVDVYGNRIIDDQVNVLTVVANESYHDFVSTMQQEYQEAGYVHAPKADNAREPVTVKFKYDKQALPDDFKELWQRIRKKTRYNLHFDSNELMKAVVTNANDIRPENMVVKLHKADVIIKDGVIRAVYSSAAVGEKAGKSERVGNIVERIANETELTKASVVKILRQLKSLSNLKRNPEEFIRKLIIIVNATKLELVLNKGLQYQEIKDTWELDIFEDIEASTSSTLPVDRSAYSHVIYDSKGEREFAENLDTSSRVEMFVKLPAKFKVPTPFGGYNPDWAIVARDDDKKQKLYLVRETKFAYNKMPEEVLGNLRANEKQKIFAAFKHFETISVDYNTVTDPTLKDLF